MSDPANVTNECKSCQLFLRMGIPLVVVVLILVVGCIIWFDRYDKRRLQKIREQKMIEKQQQRSSNTISSNTSSDNDTQTFNSTVAVTNVANNDSETDQMEQGNKNNAIITPDESTTITLSSPSYHIQRFQKLVQQVHDENIHVRKNVTSRLPIIKDTKSIQSGMDHDNDVDDQSSIESDATPVMNNNNKSSMQDTNMMKSTVIVQLPSQSNGITTEIGLLRNHLSIPSTTDTSSSSSTSSSCYSDHNETFQIAV
jgi:hypothetical protein